MPQPAPLPLAVSVGEPSGVGPDLILACHHNRRLFGLPPFFVVADADMLASRAERLGLPASVARIDQAADAVSVFDEALPVLPLAAAHMDTPGETHADNAAGTIESIERATAEVLDGRAGALVTAPIEKKALYDAGFRHPGHTEFLAALCETRHRRAYLPVMLLTGPELSTVPVTIHIPLADVPAQLTEEAIVQTARIVAHHLKMDFGLDHPRLAVSGLNPHAGEQGAMGTEDLRIVQPAVERLLGEGLDVIGPMPADTMFHAEARSRYDVALCMYHDQALIPVKTLGFDEAVNVTLGLPIIRTSPDHGTAAALAGTGKARASSFIAALNLAARMARIRAGNRQDA
ncbi:4-hydroxythreonine-4-phosphate dehydrogenase PdxA [Aureimonas frigidaquae]|uniref:4-hydroxythreonine-4-phosphate dehydrogenase n=1 Tax=Aureimonas frigidaquae TaxID=424757 RepID=A0A0P0Z2K9_9HYPH|nr:4-hydroxythreonine-4-phosphate dehydrogenase PdxA [Aureimonas frigidaquae]BAT28315.1 pyridoxal phosphate biosynthetic protein pdxA [Aureimonas frigidaquae]